MFTLKLIKAKDKVMKVNKELIKLIELMVKKEVKSAINEIKVSSKPKILEQEYIKDNSPVRPKYKPPTNPTGRTSIKDALQETYEDDSWKSMGGEQPYNSDRMGEILNKQYNDMGPGAAQPIDIAIP